MFVLPYNKDNPVRKTPWVVFALIFINGLVLIGEYVGGPPKNWFATHGFIPERASLATAFTSMFLHAGFWHYLGNMFFLWMFGNRVENMIGRWLFAATYLTSGFGATYFYYILNLHSTIPCVGASGAISGIAGCFLALFPKARFNLVFYIGWARLKSIETNAFRSGGQLPITRIDLARFQRTSKCPQHSTRRRGNHIINGRACDSLNFVGSTL